MNTIPSSVRPEPVEGPFFDTPVDRSGHEVRCFDKLSTNGILYLTNTIPNSVVEG